MAHLAEAFEVSAPGLSPAEPLRAAIRAFGRTFNERWLLERHDYRTPAQARDHLLRHAAMA